MPIEHTGGLATPATHHLKCRVCRRPLANEGKQHLLAGTNDWAHDACVTLKDGATARIYAPWLPRPEPDAPAWRIMAVHRHRDRLAKALQELSPEERAAERPALVKALGLDPPCPAP
jgi:hypothetical protein